jgi:hypothetical protein
MLYLMCTKLYCVMASGTKVMPHFRAYNKLYPYFRLLFYDVGGIWHNRSTSNSVKHL